MFPQLYIFDVDGTLRWTLAPGQRYPLATDEWRLLPNVAETLRRIEWNGPPWLALCSNQPGVGSGLITRSSARQLMQEAVVAAIGSVPLHTHIAMCTCPEGATCPRMKPNCGMLLELLEQYRVDSSAALYVGDLAIDEMAARRAGIPFTYAKAFFGSP